MYSLRKHALKLLNKNSYCSMSNNTTSSNLIPVMSSSYSSSVASSSDYLKQMKGLRLVTLDVTGTVLKFTGKIGELYSEAANHVGETIHDKATVHIGFKRAYKEVSKEHPNFGGSTMSSKDWWRLVVVKSFEYAGCTFDDLTNEIVFQEVYTMFGSNRVYEAFTDVLPFVHFLREYGVLVGVISNADDRYQDTVLPLLGFSADIDFGIYSKNVGCMKPDPKIFQIALDTARHLQSNCLKKDVKLGMCEMLSRHACFDQSFSMDQVLHIGDSYANDFMGATNAGGFSVLVDRFDSEEAQGWREKGLHVYRSLHDVAHDLKPVLRISKK